MSLSLGGGTNNFKYQTGNHWEQNETVTVFLGYGTIDIGFNELAKSLEGKFKKKIENKLLQR